MARVLFWLLFVAGWVLMLISFPAADLFGWALGGASIALLLGAVLVMRAGVR